MSTLFLLLVFLGIASLVAAGLHAVGVNLWLALVLALPLTLGLDPVLDALFAIPMRRRDRRVQHSRCPACGTFLGSQSRWQIVHPNHFVECAQCRAVCTFTPSGRLVRATSAGVGLQSVAPPNGYGGTAAG